MFFCKNIYVVHIASQFHEFVVPLQTANPLIHRLFDMSKSLITNLVRAFVRSQHMSNENGTTSFKKLRKLVLDDDKYHRVNQLA